MRKPYALVSGITKKKFTPRRQSRTQSPQAFWSAGRRLERLWDNGII